MNIKDVDFDSVFTVNEDGTVTERNDLYAPDLFEDEIGSSKWSFFSHGYTGQYGCNGPIMHNSEYLGGALLEDILNAPGTYVLVVSYYDNEDEAMRDVEPTISEGWAVLTLNA